MVVVGGRGMAFRSAVAVTQVKAWKTLDMCRDGHGEQ